MHLETEKTLEGSVLPVLERLHKEIKAKAKELQGAGSKNAKQVDHARAATQKHIEMLGQQVATFDSAAGVRLEQHSDPYVLRRGITHRLNKQITEENNSHHDILEMQTSFQDFEAHVVQTIQSAVDQFFQAITGQTDRERAMYIDMLNSAKSIPADFEWNNFYKNNKDTLIDPTAGPRSLSTVTYPNIDHRATHPLIEGTLERKSRAFLKGSSTAYFVVTQAHYLHQFADDDDLRHDPVPDLSLYLPDCVMGGIDGAEFAVKGKDVSGGKVGNAFHATHELTFKAHTPADAEMWWNTMRAAVTGHTAPSSTGPSAAAAPPTTAESAQADPTNGDAATTASENSPTSGISRSGSHYHTGPGGPATDKA